MPWEYRELPDALRLPKCPHCGNVGAVQQLTASIFVCQDCRPSRLFCAVWRPETRQVTSISAPVLEAGQRKEQAG